MLMSYFRPINRTWNLRRRQVFEKKERRLSDFHIACNIAPKMYEKGSSVFTLHSCTRITVQTIKSMDIWRPHETTPRKEGECNAVPSLSSCAPCIPLGRLTQWFSFFLAQGYFLTRRQPLHASKTGNVYQADTLFNKPRFMSLCDIVFMQRNCDLEWTSTGKSQSWVKQFNQIILG